MKTLFIILSVLSSFLANLETKTLQSDYVVTVNDNMTSPINYPGTITMSGNLFKLDMFNLEAAYDGKTMYMYSPETDELTLSNPTEQELIETNPLSLREMHSLSFCSCRHSGVFCGPENIRKQSKETACSLIFISGLTGFHTSLCRISGFRDFRRDRGR